jgi:hypothetical protein
MNINMLGVANEDSLIWNSLKKEFGQKLIPFVDHDNKNLPNFIIALTGQSNAEGYGTSYDPNNSFDQPNERIFGWNPSLQRWEIADLRTESLGYNYDTFKQSGTQCSAFHFAKRLIEAYPNIRPGIINIGVSGATIGFWTNWLPTDKYYNFTINRLSWYEGKNTFPDYKTRPQGYIFDVHIYHIKLALENLPQKNRKVNVICWDQGETDPELDFFKSSLDQVIKRYINTLNNLGYYQPSMFGFLAVSTTGMLYQNSNKVNDVLVQLSKDGIPFTKYIDASDLPVSTQNGFVDMYHFNSQAQRIIGTEFFRQYRNIFV